MEQGLINASLRIIETQGLVGFLLLLQILIASRERTALLRKNCELSHFIMVCLKQKLDEDSPLNGSSPASPKSSNFNDLPP